MLKNFRTYNLAVEFYRLCERTKIKGNLRDQLMRAASSIPLNLAEGSAKPTPKDRKRFYFIALGSFREVEAILDLTNQEELKHKADNLGAHLYLLCNRRPSLKN